MGDGSVDARQRTRGPDSQTSGAPYRRSRQPHARQRSGHGSLSPPVGEVAAALDATDKDIEIGRAGLAAAAIELGLVDELRMFRYPIVVGGGKPFLPPITAPVRLDLAETRTMGSRVIYERSRRVRDESN